MRKIIVTTTINEPTLALKKFAKFEDWELIVVGDLKTPHKSYEDFNCHYLSPEIQEKKFPELSRLIGWNCIMRRNIGYLEAYKKGADIIASIDDDNIPYQDWGNDLYVNKEIEIDIYKSSNNYFDALSVTNHNELWHRGYPIEFVPSKNNVIYLGKQKRKVLIQADLWDGDPDIDAICRLSKMPIIKFNRQKPFASVNLSPFNSQNTFFSREVIPYYSVLPHVGRMDDIWGGYLLQNKFPNSLIFNRASVYQERNPQDLIKNLQDEIIGYKETLKLIKDFERLDEILPEKTKKFLDHYHTLF